MINTGNYGEFYEVTDPVKFSKASGYLWNEKMMIHINCRGYAVSQFMQPEPAKYSKGPMLEEKTFMQPEQGYYTEHPGRFVFVKDEETNDVFSVPYDPMRVSLNQYKFIVEKHQISWKIINKELEIVMRLALPVDDVKELWTIKVKNLSKRKRKISIYPYFTIGYMSWMNQSGKYNSKFKSIICSSITPYQKYEDYFKIKEFKDITFLSAYIEPDSWEANYEKFIGEGGLFNPSSIYYDKLKRWDAIYEMPVAVMQYRLNISSGEVKTYNFIFGPAKDENEIATSNEKYFNKNKSLSNDNLFEPIINEYKEYINKGKGCIIINTPDNNLDQFVNHWLPRQVYYHGSTNRLTTDPQTRNYIQDNMGMSYINPKVTRKAFLKALSQQNFNGSMPDGILLHKDAKLKYINQVPHTDHCTWLSICIKAYLDETNDYSIFEEVIPYSDTDIKDNVFEHINKAMNWLLRDRNELGLNYIRQGDWCDPMNMVGYKDRGVSGWLTLATAYAIKIWSDICNILGDFKLSNYYKKKVDELNKAVNEHLWDGEWYGRGITDDGVIFGVKKDNEGKIFLNPQSFSILSGAADKYKQKKIIKNVKKYLETPYGYEMLAPAYTKMREDVGRVTQKFPGSAENGAIYNHAAAFYGYAMVVSKNSDEAYNVIRKMIPGPENSNILHREQLPIFVPNYYRGAYEYFKRTCGKSSQLFNTGTVSWLYRMVIEGIFGLIGCPEGLKIDPQLPSDWNEAHAIRSFRGATFDINIYKEKDNKFQKIYVDDQKIEGNIIKYIKSGNNYNVKVIL